MTRRAFTAWLMVAVLWAGCGEDLPSVTSIERMRLLGARASVEGDPERATPRPGENATLDFVVAFPSLEQDHAAVRSLFITCTPPDRFTGIPICQEFLDAALTADTADAAAALEVDEPIECMGDLELPIGVGISVACVSGDPKVTVAVPEGFEGDGRLVRGVVCEDGTPFIDPFDPLLFGCKSDNEEAQEIRVHATVFVEQERSQRNHNPDPSGFEFKFNGAVWDPVDLAELPSEDDCKEAAASKVVLKVQAIEKKHDIQIEYDPEVREKFDGEPEIVEISSYGTAGEMERRFTIFEPDEQTFENTLEWKSPKVQDVGSKGQLVRFYFSVIDQRGGFAITTREICLE